MQKPLKVNQRYKIFYQPGAIASIYKSEYLQPEI